jgi:hypothetical protein
VRNCLLAAGELGLPVHLKVIVTRSHPLSDLLKELDDALALSAARVEPIPCYPFGRASELVSPSDFYLREGIPMTPCPGATLTISPSGEALPCCNPGGDGEMLVMGNVRERGIKDVAHTFTRGPLMHLIHTTGPGYFVPAIRERGLGHKLLPAYVSVCHLCGQIASDPELAEVARDVACQEEERRLAARCEKVIATIQQTLEGVGSPASSSMEEQGVGDD